MSKSWYTTIDDNSLLFQDTALHNTVQKPAQCQLFVTCLNCFVAHLVKGELHFRILDILMTKLRLLNEVPKCQISQKAPKSGL